MITGATIAYTASTSEELFNYLNNNTVDVLFLDIDLNSTLNGIEIAKRIRKNNKLVYIIFVTAHFEYIVSAYECKTFDFIHKPFNISMLEKTVNRLAEDIKYNSTNFLNLNNSRQLINFIEKAGAKTVYNLTTGIVETYGSFNKISGTLPKNFIRSHKSFIVNTQNVTNLDPVENRLYL